MKLTIILSQSETILISINHHHHVSLQDFVRDVVLISGVEGKWDSYSLRWANNDQTSKNDDHDNEKDDGDTDFDGGDSLLTENVGFTVAL